MRGMGALLRFQQHWVLSLLCLALWTLSNAQLINVRTFGAVGNGIADDTDAFRKAADLVSGKGGTIYVPRGTFRVGWQVFSGGYGAGFSFHYQPVLQFRHTKRAIRVVGDSAVIKVNDHLKFGSFDPVSGLPDSARMKGHQSDYYASAYEIISAEDCDSIFVDGLELDGNFSNLELGPGFGHINIQLAAIGIRLSRVKYAKISNASIHHCGLDGITILWNGLNDAAPRYPHILDNVKVQYCGRQALSFVGGNSLVATKCTFSHTGRLSQNGRSFYSPPSAGIDLECEDAVIKNLTFSDCLIADNVGPGLSTIGHPLKNVIFRRCTFIGTTNSAIYPKSSGLSFYDCTFIGKVERLFGSKNPEMANRFVRCVFTYECPAAFSMGVLKEQHEFYEAVNVVFDKCVFHFGDIPLPRSSGLEATFKNCELHISNNSESRFSVNFMGENRIILKKINVLDLTRSKKYGVLRLNGKSVSINRRIVIK